MSNILHGLGLIYFQMPDHIADLVPEMSGNAARLALVVYREAQRRSKPVLAFTPRALIDATGLNKNALSPAIDELVKLGLMRVTRLKGAQWTITFELLDAETGLPIPTLKGRQLSASHLTDAQQKLYVLTKLLPWFSHWDEDGTHLWSRCPFHESAKQKATLCVRTGASGLTWKCHHDGCSQSEGGSIIDMEMALADKQSKAISTTTAWERIVSAIRGAERNEQIAAQALDDAHREMATA